jgi:xanthine/uracil permease
VHSEQSFGFLVYYHEDENAKLPNGTHWGYKAYASSFGSEIAVPADITFSPDAQSGNFTVTIDSSLITATEVAFAMQMIVGDQGSPIPAGTGESVNIIVPAAVVDIFDGTDNNFIVDTLN